MKDDEIQEFSLSEDEQTELLEYFEKHPEEQERLTEAIKQTTEAMGEVIRRMADILPQIIEAVTNLAANLAEAKRTEEEDSEDD